MLIAILFINYGPYHFSRLAASQKKFHHFNCNVVGIELSRYETIYPWKTKIDNWNDKFISIISDQPREKVKTTVLINKLSLVLSQINPDVIAIAGYADIGMLYAFLWSILHQKPTILLSETKEDDAHRSWWRENFKRWFLKGYKTALVGGKPQKRYLIKLGMNPKSIFTGCDVVGNDDFNPNKIKSLPVPHQKPYFLAINRFVPKKNLSTLISSYGNYRQTAGVNAWDLVLCGDGELRVEIEQQIAELNLQDSVHLPGFLQQDELLPYFAHAKSFIHASIQEQWGLVVNEAMAAGLPVLVSNRCGCFEDLIIEGVNGFGFDPENPEQLTELMVKMSSDDINLEKMSQASLEHIQKFSPDYFAEGLMQAVQYALANS
ncbi:glycosyltransferase family 4 protein [Moorena sp. SIO3H5]|uniref:glycosyltransferase family 4 protein n=1 Tax=Moorena sp. SIO3H5 TaxID=2607834 RepID=UPI0013BAD84B|nr:glycosyltransferase family 4 protein [Moorena sp. SIO3H5]NEO68919.1 glycosyltransferase family 4 protein [Moorena sp. SIO3H5]